MNFPKCKISIIYPALIEYRTCKSILRLSGELGSAQWKTAQLNATKVMAFRVITDDACESIIRFNHS